MGATWLSLSEPSHLRRTPRSAPRLYWRVSRRGTGVLLSCCMAPGDWVRTGSIPVEFKNVRNGRCGNGETGNERCCDPIVSHRHKECRIQNSDIEATPLLLPCNRSRFQPDPLVPPVEPREVTRIPCLAQSRGAQIPVGADFARHGA